MLVYVTLVWTIVALAMFIYEMNAAQEFNSWAILCLVLTILGVVAFVLNRVLYSLFKVRDPKRYEVIECPYCHAVNKKDALFCHSCGKPLQEPKRKK